MKSMSIIKIQIIVLLLISNYVPAQKEIKISNLKSNFVLKENKDRYYKNLIEKIESTFKSNIKINLFEWSQALKDAESILLKDDFVKIAVGKSLSLPIDKHIKLQRTVLGTAYALFKVEFQKQINNLFLKTKDKLSYAISVNYLTRSNYEKRNRIFYLNDLKSRFKDYQQNSLLNNLLYDLNNPANQKFNQQPNIKDLLTHKFQKGKTIVYSFHRRNRLYPGITVIKKPDGSFVKNSDSSIFNIPQLAVSYSNLPGYISNGNTPEGIYSIIGWYISPTETIGPTPNLLVRSPFEVSPEIFFHKRNEYNKWNINDYSNLLPDSWKNYFPIYQSFYAGKSGRKLIIIHGSTDELNYFRDQLYFPLTPTRGCLSSSEIWSEENGECLESDQAKLIIAFKSTRQKKGFLVVVELDNKEKPISINEIENFFK